MRRDFVGKLFIPAAAFLLCACSGSFKDLMNDAEKFALGGDSEESKKPDDAPKDKAPDPAASMMKAPVLGGTNTEVKSTSSAHCCVNGAYYTCNSGADAARCLGEPMKLMQCVQGCGFDSSCEPKCIKSHGPDPSPCKRVMAKDRECKRR